MGAVNNKEPLEKVTQAAYNVSDATSRQVHIKIPTSLLGPSQGNASAVVDLDLNGTRTEFNTKQPKSRAFCVMNILSDFECDALIEATESEGYNKADDVKYEYPENYRNNQRMIVINSDFARTLWGRLSVHLMTKDIFNVTPIGFLSDGMLPLTVVCFSLLGIWVPVGLNDGFVFSKYSPGQFFKPHQDGLYISKNEEYSIFSVVFYLNELCGSKGGNLNFLDNDKRVCASFTPKKGSAIIFNSDALHEGELLKDGYKYLMRTFIMFKCVKSFSEQEKNTVTGDPNWQSVVQTFMEIERAAKRMGHLSTAEIQKFTDDYLKAQSIQCARSNTIREWNSTMPLDAYRLIFSHLRAYHIIKAMRINREWYRVGRDNEVWRRCYNEDFPSSTEQPSTVKEFNYFGLYRSRVTDVQRTVMVLSNNMTYLAEDTPTSRVAGVQHLYNKWDQSMMQLLTHYEHYGGEEELQTWYDNEEQRLAGYSEKVGKYRPTIVNHLNYLSHVVLKTRPEKNLLLVYFPLHFMLKPELKSNGKLTTQGGEERASKCSRIPEKVLKFLLENAFRIEVYQKSDGTIPEARLGFLEVSVAACCALDLRNAIVVLSQRIVSEDIIQIVVVKDLVVNSKKDRFFSFSKDAKKIADYLDQRVEKFSKNIVFISDLAFDLSADFQNKKKKPAKPPLAKEKKKDKNSAPERPVASYLNPAKQFPALMKNRNIANFWTAQDLDLYYGAMKYQSSLLTLFPHKLQTRAIESRYHGYIESDY